MVVGYAERVGSHVTVYTPAPKATTTTQPATPYRTGGGGGGGRAEPEVRYTYSSVEGKWIPTTQTGAGTYSAEQYKQIQREQAQRGAAPSAPAGEAPVTTILSQTPLAAPAPPYQAAPQQLKASPSDPYSVQKRTFTTQAGAREETYQFSLKDDPRVKIQVDIPGPDVKERAVQEALSAGYQDYLSRTREAKSKGLEVVDELSQSEFERRARPGLEAEYEAGLARQLSTPEFKKEVTAALETKKVTIQQQQEPAQQVESLKKFYIKSGTAEQLLESDPLKKEILLGPVGAIGGKYETFGGLITGTLTPEQQRKQAIENIAQDLAEREVYGKEANLEYVVSKSLERPATQIGIATGVGVGVGAAVGAGTAVLSAKSALVGSAVSSTAFKAGVAGVTAVGAGYTVGTTEAEVRQLEAQGASPELVAGFRGARYGSLVGGIAGGVAGARAGAKAATSYLEKPIAPARTEIVGKQLVKQPDITQEQFFVRGRYQVAATQPETRAMQLFKTAPKAEQYLVSEKGVLVKAGEEFGKTGVYKIIKPTTTGYEITRVPKGTVGQIVSEGQVGKVSAGQFQRTYQTFELPKTKGIATEQITTFVKETPTAIKGVSDVRLQATAETGKIAEQTAGRILSKFTAPKYTEVKVAPQPLPPGAPSGKPLYNVGGAFTTEGKYISLKLLEPKAVTGPAVKAVPGIERTAASTTLREISGTMTTMYDKAYTSFGEEVYGGAVKFAPAVATGTAPSLPAQVSPTQIESPRLRTEPLTVPSLGLITRTKPETVPVPPIPIPSVPTTPRGPEIITREIQVQSQVQVPALAQQVVPITVTQQVPAFAPPVPVRVPPLVPAPAFPFAGRPTAAPEPPKARPIKLTLKAPKAIRFEKPKKDYLPSVITAGISKLLYGKATRPKKITKEIEELSYVSVPTQELIKAGRPYPFRISKLR